MPKSSPCRDVHKWSHWVKKKIANLWQTQTTNDGLSDLPVLPLEVSVPFKDALEFSLKKKMHLNSYLACPLQQLEFYQ